MESEGWWWRRCLWWWKFYGWPLTTHSLKALEMFGYVGVRFSNWFSWLTNLVELYITNRNNCQHLPPLYQLPSLRKLYIEKMDGLDLEYVTNLDNIVDNGNAAMTTSTSTSTSTSSSHQYKQHMPLSSFPCLFYSCIWNCYKLTCMPLFPNLEKEFSLMNTSLKLVQQTIVMNNTGFLYFRPLPLPLSTSSLFSPN